jgi:hypothetical protein
MTDHKPLKKSSSEPCPEHCEGRITGPDTYCQCIEKFLPPMGAGRKVKKVHYRESMDTAPNPEQLYVSTVEQGVDAMENALRSYGLDDWEVRLMMARVVEEKTLAELQAEQGWVSPGHAAYHLRATIKKLRERGFKI